MATLKNHPGYWLRDDAAESLARWEADHGWINLTSAGRYEWEQQGLIDRWFQGGTYNRPPYLYEPKRPARASDHVKNGGEALDTNEHNRFRRTSADYGWWQPYTWDVVHFVYDPKRDKHRNRPSGGGASTPASTTTPEKEEDEDMPKNSGVHYKTSQNTWVYLVFNTGSGFAHEFSNGANGGTMPGTYTAQLKISMDISGWSSVTESHARVIKNALAAVRPKDAPKEVEVTIVSAEELASLDAATINDA